MEPTRKKVDFERLEGAEVMMLYRGQPKRVPLFVLGDECFVAMDELLIQLLVSGFTMIDGLRWETFFNLPTHIRCNSLGRIVTCQNSATTTPAKSLS